MLMSKAKTKSARRTELDSVYLLKMVLYLVIGSLWLRVHLSNQVIPLPLGFVAGVWIAARERFRIDRKLEYAVLLMAMFIGFWLPIGINIVY